MKLDMFTFDRYFKQVIELSPTTFPIVAGFVTRGDYVAFYKSKKIRTIWLTEETKVHSIETWESDNESECGVVNVCGYETDEPILVYEAKPTFCAPLYGEKYR